MKPIARYLKEGNITFYQSDKEVLIKEVYEQKEHELRGVWFSTVNNIDLPITKSEEELKEYMQSVLQTVKEYRMNTIVFQVRPTNDAFYESDLNPWSEFITGVQGKSPGFDLLGWFVEEAKKEGISIHAWINPYRVISKKLSDLSLTKEEYLASLDSKNFAKNNPDCVIETSETKLILNPACAKVREFVSDSVVEIARKYDIKAVHIDDYFYPYEAIIDPKEEEQFKASDFDQLSDYRRHQVNLLIEMIHIKLKELPKKVEFGISPFGIYRTNVKWFKEPTSSSWEFGSNNHFSCYNCYEGLYADIYLWMEKGWIDYVVPQGYFDLDYWKQDADGNWYEVVKYADLASWWSWACASTNVKLYMGQGLYRMKDDGSNWSNPEEIINQLKFNHTLDNCLGAVFFTYKNLIQTENRALTKAQARLKETWIMPSKDI